MMRDTAAIQQRRVLLIARLFMVAVTLVFVVLLGRIVQLQHRPPANIAIKVTHRGTDTTLLARRGGLHDARGRPLAISRFGHRLFVDPQLIDDPSTFALHVAHAVGDDPARIDQLIHERIDRRYVVVQPLLNDRQAEAVRELRVAGLATEPVAVRHYPQGATGGHVLGFVGDEHGGLDGLEFALDSILGGEPGAVRTLRDARRRPLWIERAGYRPPTDGRDVQLSIDTVVQQIAERELAAACEQYEAARGELVVMDSRTGQLLAMANWPPFDPNEPLLSTSEQRRNRCVTDPYEPGSSFKPFLHAAATQQGLARPEQIIDCTTSGVAYFGRRRLRDAHAHGEITWDQVLVVSSNIGMARVAGPMGNERMHGVLEAFGFGRRTGTALPGESPGIVNPLGQWTSYSLSSIPMGQEIAVTPVQMVKAFSAFANGGLMVTPTVLAAEARSPLYQRVLEPSIADHTRSVLRRAVAEGTGRRANSEKYRVWGKTGTAQVPDRVNGGYKAGAYTGNFICGAPFEDPRIIVLAAIHEPSASVGYYGGVIAAPAAKSVVEQTLTYLGVAPDGDGDFTGETSLAIGEGRRP